MSQFNVFAGTIEDYFAHTGLYQVRLPGGGAVVNATLVNSTSMLPLGVRPVGGLAPKTNVLVASLAGIHYILGAVGTDSGDPRMLLPDSLTICGRSGFFEDLVHNVLFGVKTQLLGNYSAGRPADTLAGDWGGINDLGVAVFIGRLMAALKASDAAKIEAFWGDDLLRTVGYNFEHFTSCLEHRDFNDEGENHVVTRGTPFPWEALGIITPNTTAALNADGKLGSAGRETSKYEPLTQDQLMIARTLRLGGYLGDVERQWVALPPKDLETETYAAETIYSGLSEITRNLNGALHARSAKAITSEKYALIPVPKELIQPDDATGDDDTNYAAAGQLGSGDKPDMAEFVWGTDDNAAIRAAQYFDYAAYLVNKYFSPGLEKHVKDWKYPDEADVADMKDAVQSAVYNKSMKSGHKFRLDFPVYSELKIDDRQNHTCRYYGSRSIISQLDDGSILLEDGYGSQIFMSAGNIELSCVGDIWLRPGRNLVAWAPHDAVVKAGNSVDISASKKDVRIKAEQNLHMLGGNNGTTGGILLESRSEGADLPTNYEQIGERVTGRGITLKASKSSINAFGKDLYIGRGQTESGRLVIDAGANGYLLMTGEQILSRATDLHVVSVKGPADARAQLIALNGQAAAITVPVQIEGDVQIVEGEKTKGNLLVGGSAVVYGAGLVQGGNVGPSDEVKRRYPAETISQQLDDTAEKINEQMDDRIEEAIEDPDSAPGSDDFQEKVGFSCRDTVEDLKLDESFVLYEVRWQQMMRERGEATETWDEPLVRAPNGEQTAPHPGFKGWMLDQSFAEVDLVNYDLTVGAAKARDSMVIDGGVPEKKTLDGAYTVNAQS